jgi:hypothetical protein
MKLLLPRVSGSFARVIAIRIAGVGLRVQQKTPDTEGAVSQLWLLGQRRLRGGPKPQQLRLGIRRCL